MDRINWDYFNKFNDILVKYLPMEGEGDTMATQIVTAINKLIYKWYNDGDVYDNTYYMTGWCNDLSSYANWLAQLPAGYEFLEKIKVCRTYFEYETILKNLADNYLNEAYLKNYASENKFGSIYDCDGPFHFEEYDSCEEDEDFCEEE
jgi:hypothetical protein